MSDTVDDHIDGPSRACLTEHPAVENDVSDSGQHRFLTGCVFAALLYLTGQWFWLSMQRPDPLPWHQGTSFQKFFRVDINSATWVEWIQLRGIGETMAHRIVADREFNGPFTSIEDLRRVDGIGPSTLDRIRPWLTIGHAKHTEQQSETVRSPKQQSGSL
ncbi:MAG: helix-hairpin-helix domain-containing protein [Fuerstiella sp.]|nr:helix-hairpin-helix domain-containing protein [Fuerstiella sp.]